MILSIVTEMAHSVLTCWAALSGETEAHSGKWEACLLRTTAGPGAPERRLQQQSGMHRNQTPPSRKEESQSPNPR